jgi:endonuclease-3
MQTKSSTIEILKILDKKYGKVEPFLNHESPFQLLIAVILSAQTTDLMVNKVTLDLFDKYPDAKSLKVAPLEEVEKIISRINYYKTKSKHIKETARLIDETFLNEVPSTIAELITLPGVGRKVANVIVAEIFGIPEGVVVDTHVKRVSYRVGWTKSTDPKKIEQDLMKIIPIDHFVNIPKQLILIGRNYCFPKKPNCSECPLNKVCEKNSVV